LNTFSRIFFFCSFWRNETQFIYECPRHQIKPYHTLDPLQGCIKFQIPSPFGKLFKRGGKKGRIIGKKEKKGKRKKKSKTEKGKKIRKKG